MVCTIARILEETQQQSFAEADYQRLLSESSTPNKRRNLEILWQVLNEMRSKDAPDYNIAAVGRRSEELGGPKTQSIRNTNGVHFRELIEAFAKQNAASTKKTPIAQISQVDVAISRIPDLAVRTVLKMMVADCKRLKHENDMLRSAFKRLSVDTRSLGAPATQDAPTRDAEPIDMIPPRKAQPLDAPTARAFTRFLSDDWMEERGWRIEPDGSITDTTMDWLVAPPGFADALRDLLLDASKWRV
jgi:hypothetical protein